VVADPWRFQGMHDLSSRIDPSYRFFVESYWNQALMFLPNRVEAIISNWFTSPANKNHATITPIDRRSAMRTIRMKWPNTLERPAYEVTRAIDSTNEDILIVHLDGRAESIKVPSRSEFERYYNFAEAVNVAFTRGLLAKLRNTQQPIGETR
jgi:hypothetical protein